jgi:hypothetical protein
MVQGSILLPWSKPSIKVSVHRRDSSTGSEQA